MPKKDKGSDLEARLRQLADRARSISDDSIRQAIQREIDELRKTTQKKQKSNIKYFTSEEQVSPDLYERVDCHSIITSLDYAAQSMLMIKSSRATPFDYRHETIGGCKQIYTPTHIQKHLGSLRDKLREQAIEFAVENDFDAVLVAEKDITITWGISNLRWKPMLRYSGDVIYNGMAKLTLYKRKPAAKGVG